MVVFIGVGIVSRKCLLLRWPWWDLLSSACHFELGEAQCGINKSTTAFSVISCSACLIVDPFVDTESLAIFLFCPISSRIEITERLDVLRGQQVHDSVVFSDSSWVLCLGVSICRYRVISDLFFLSREFEKRYGRVRRVLGSTCPWCVVLSDVSSSVCLSVSCVAIKVKVIFFFYPISSKRKHERMSVVLSSSVF